MTDRKQALQGLLAKVETNVNSMGHEWIDGFGHDNFAYASQAFSGSIDAFVALLNAVLPGWWWQVSATWNGKAHVALYPPNPPNPAGTGKASGSNPDPARAGLIAILKALIAKECDA